jgi:hypothetical protein
MPPEDDDEDEEEEEGEEDDDSVEKLANDVVVDWGTSSKDVDLLPAAAAATDTT